MSETLWLQPGLQAPARARRWLSRWCEQWRCDDIADDAALLLSELITNAALHAGTTITVSARMTGNELRVAVADRQPGELAGSVKLTAADAASAEGGRGLPIVAAVAHSWGVQSHPGGKHVWFTLMSERLAHVDRTVPALA